MSGWNKSNGVFNLTFSKAHYWHRKEFDSSLGFKDETMEYYVEVLRRAGLAIVETEGNWAKVRATPGQIWTALSGEPSDPSREAYYR